MGAGAAPGLAAAAKVATVEELESVFGTFSKEQRQKLDKALQEAPLEAARRKPTLEVFLDMFDKDASGRMDAAKVKAAIDIFNALDKRGLLKARDKDDQMACPRAGNDGKVGRTGLGAAVTLWIEGPPQRNLEEVVQVFQEIEQIQQLYIEWCGDLTQPLPEDLAAACVFFNKWADRASEVNRHGRMLINYYDTNLYGPEPSRCPFTKWIWEELKTIEDKFRQPSVSTFRRLQQAMALVQFFLRHDWDSLDGVRPTALGPSLAAYDGVEWEKMTDAEQQQLESRVLGRLGLASNERGLVCAKAVRKWLREEVIQLPVERIPIVIMRLEDFMAVAFRESLDEATKSILASFHRWDINGKKTISTQDLRHVMSKIDAFSQEELDALLAGASPGKDGRVDYTNFTHWVLAAP